MSDNTRKTSNIIHTVDDLNTTVNEIKLDVENNTESIGNIKVYDSHIWLSTSKGLTVTQDGNTTTNNDQPTEWKLEADTNYLNNTLDFAKPDDIPSVYVKDIKSGDITTLTVEEEDGVYTLTALGGGGGGGGIDNITLAEGTCIKIDSEQYDDNGTTKTRLTINTDTDCLNTTLNFAKPTDIGNGNITLKSTDNTVSITGQNATANQTTDTAWDLSVNIPTPPTPITPGDGAINLTGGTGIDIAGANGTANQTSDSSQTISIDSTVALKSDIVVPGDGNITLSNGTGINISGTDATANQTGDSGWSVSIDDTVALKSDIPTIPPAVVPGDGNITLTEGDGIKVSGSDATANQTSDTAWTVKTDNDYLNTTLNFAKPDQIPTDLGVLTIENITPHSDGNFDFKSSDDALVVDDTAHGLSLSIDEDKLPFVKDIKSGNELTLTVDDDGNGTVTLTAAGGGGGAGNIAFSGGKCIDVVSDNNATTNVTTYTINNDLDCLNNSLGFATDQDIADAIDGIVIPEKTSDLTNDGEDGSNPFITAADIHLPIQSDDGTVVLDSPSANTFTVSTGNAGQIRLEPGATSNNYFRVYDTGSPNSAMLCARNSISSGFTVRPYKETVSGNNFSVFNLLWDYTAESVDFTNATNNFVLSSYSAPSPKCKGDTYFGFNVGGLGSNTNFTLAAGLHLNVAVNTAADKEAFSILSTGTAPSRFNGQVQTPTVKGVVDTDAQIDLDGNLTLDNKSGRIWLGKATNAPAGTTNLFVGSSDGDGKNLFIGSGQPKTAAEAGSGISFATVAGNGDRSRQTRMFISPSGNVGINDTSPDEKLSVAGNIQAQRVKGFSSNPQLIFEFQDAQIKTHDDLSFTPTQPDSIATKQYVDDNAGAAGLVPFGTPTDDTTPDSPNGSTLHDNMYLYVKGSTSWKKAALYPLDSSGGGSIFPLPQPGENSGEVWDTVQFTSGSSVGQNKAAVSRAGNVFFLANSWSVDGEDWYQCVWSFNGGTQTATSFGIVSSECLTASAGNGVYCGWYGYSYDGQSWNLYEDNIRANGGCFFWQGKHWSSGGLKYFDGETLQATDNPNIAGQIGGIPLVVASDSTLMCIGLTNESGYSRGPVKRFVGNMATNGTWEPQGAGTSDFLQACHGVAWDGLSDKWVFITNSKAYVQKTSGNFSKSNFDEIALPTTATWAGLVHDGNRFVAVAENAGANVSIWSEDGRTWTTSNDLNNPGLTSLAGFNGRVVGAGSFTTNDKATCIVTGNPTSSFRSLEFEGTELTSQRQTNEFLLQEISRLQKLIEEKCDS